MPNTSYKQQKEDFVSGLSGGSAAEVNIIAAVTIVRPTTPTLALMMTSQNEANHLSRHRRLLACGPSFRLANCSSSNMASLPSR